MGNGWLERYDSGEREAVWAELRSLGPGVFEPGVVGEARAVADATMARAAGNVATLCERLSAMGFRFYQPWFRNRSGQGPTVEEGRLAWSPPDPEVLERIDRAEALLGPLPLALEAFWRRVGPIDLGGSLPSWDPAAFDFEDDAWPARTFFADPLQLFGPEMVVNRYDAAHGVLTLAKDGDQRVVEIAADAVTKAGMSGGCYTIRLPQLRADPLVDTARPAGETFVGYLRRCFAWGGFPGVEGRPELPPGIAELRRGLLDL
jgi:hypothetical protein